MDIGNWWPSSARINPRTPENRYIMVYRRWFHSGKPSTGPTHDDLKHAELSLRKLKVGTAEIAALRLKARDEHARDARETQTTISSWPEPSKTEVPYERKLTAAEREAAETARYNPTRKPTRKSITATRMPDGGTKVCTTSTKRESDHMTKLFMKMNRSKPGTEIRQNPAMPRRPSNISEAKWNRWIEDWRRIGGRKGAKKVKTFAVAGERRRK